VMLKPCEEGLDFNDVLNGGTHVKSDRAGASAIRCPDVDARMTGANRPEMAPSSRQGCSDRRLDPLRANAPSNSETSKAANARVPQHDAQRRRERRGSGPPAPAPRRLAAVRRGFGKRPGEKVCQSCTRARVAVAAA
jgi:hypothetical protein